MLKSLPKIMFLSIFSLRFMSFAFVFLIDNNLIHAMQHYFDVKNSEEYSAFTMLYNSYLCLAPKHFYHPRKKSHSY